MEENATNGWCEGMKQGLIEGWDLFKIMWSNMYINDKRMRNVYKGLYFRSYIGLIVVLVREVYSPNEAIERLDM